MAVCYGRSAAKGYLPLRFLVAMAAARPSYEEKDIASALRTTYPDNLFAAEQRERMAPLQPSGQPVGEKKGRKTMGWRDRLFSSQRTHRSGHEPKELVAWARAGNRGAHTPQPGRPRTTAHAVPLLVSKRLLN